MVNEYKKLSLRDISLGRYNEHKFSHVETRGIVNSISDWIHNEQKKDSENPTYSLNVFFEHAVRLPFTPRKLVFARTYTSSKESILGGTAIMRSSLNSHKPLSIRGKLVTYPDEKPYLVLHEIEYEGHIASFREGQLLL